MSLESFNEIIIYKEVKTIEFKQCIHLILITLTVVNEPYEVATYDEVTTPGNDVVLRCRVPPDVADIVTVTSWLKDGAINIFPNQNEGQITKYFLELN